MPGEGAMSLLGNERVKLTATWLNTLASATATVGVLAPLASMVYGVGPQSLSPLFQITAMTVWFFAAVGLHIAARHVLRGLRQ
jgi:hypothetical protein